MSDLITGPVIVTKYCAQTNSRESRILATHRRDGETVWRCYWNYDQNIDSDSNHLAAARKLLALWPYDNKLSIIGSGYDAKARYFLCSASHT